MSASTPYLIHFNGSDSVEAPGPIINPPLSTEPIIKFPEPGPGRDPVYITSAGENKPLTFKSISRSTQPKDIPKESLWYIKNHDGGGTYLESAAQGTTLRAAVAQNGIAVITTQEGDVWYIRVSSGKWDAPDGFKGYVSKPSANPTAAFTTNTDTGETDLGVWKHVGRKVEMSELILSLTGFELIFTPVKGV